MNIPFNITNGIESIGFNKQYLTQMPKTKDPTTYSEHSYLATGGIKLQAGDTFFYKPGPTEGWQMSGHDAAHFISELILKEYGTTGPDHKLFDASLNGESRASISDKIMENSYEVQVDRDGKAYISSHYSNNWHSDPTESIHLKELQDTLDSGHLSLKPGSYLLMDTKQSIQQDAEEAVAFEVCDTVYDDLHDKAEGLAKYSNELVDLETFMAYAKKDLLQDIRLYFSTRHETPRLKATLEFIENDFLKKPVRLDDMKASAEAVISAWKKAIKVSNPHEIGAGLLMFSRGGKITPFEEMYSIYYSADRGLRNDLREAYPNLTIKPEKYQKPIVSGLLYKWNSFRLKRLHRSVQKLVQENKEVSLSDKGNTKLHKLLKKIADISQISYGLTLVNKDK